MFYDLYCALCDSKGVSPTRAALDIGISKSLPTSWKNSGTKPKSEILNKIAVYFNVSVDYLLGNEKSAQAAEGVDADTIDFSNLRNADGTPVSDEKMKIIMRILSMGLEDTRNLHKWIDFMDDLNREKK